MVKQILDFCFHEAGSQKFFEKDVDFDQLLIERFSEVLKQAAATSCCGRVLYLAYQC